MHEASSDRLAEGVVYTSKKAPSLSSRCPNRYCVSNYKAANGSFCIEGCHDFVQADCAALKAYNQEQVITVMECVTESCGWVGLSTETVHPKHDPTDLCCPKCNDTVEGRDVRVTLAKLQEGVWVPCAF